MERLLILVVNSNFVEYGVDKDTERINYDEVRKLVRA